MISEIIKKRTTEQLKYNYKSTKTVVSILIALLLLLIFAAIYGLLTKDNNPVFISILVVGIFCCGALPHQFKFMKIVKKELYLRKEIV